MLEIYAERRRARAASPRRPAGAHLQRPRQHRLQGRRRRARAAGRRQRPGRLVEEARAPTARNGNELTHQRLTDIGRAPSFYDCLVEVEPAAATGRGVRRGARMAAWASAASPRPRSSPAPTVCLTSGCSTIGYYAQSVDRPPRPARRRRGRCRSGSPIRRRAPRLKAAPRALAADPRLRRQRARRARQRQLSPLRRPAARRPRSGTSSPRPSSRSMLKTWCFAVVGCVGYRGYYDRGARRGVRRRAARAKASTSPSIRCRRTRRSAGCRPAAGSPTRCSTPSSTIPKASSRG